MIFLKPCFWYEAQQEGLKNKFLSELKLGIDYLSKDPYNFQKRHRDVRVLFIQIFPFGIHFVIQDAIVKVIAVFHMGRDPKNWTRSM